MSQSVQCKFDWALSHTRRSDAAEKKKKILASTFGQIRLWTSFESSPVSVNRYRTVCPSRAMRILALEFIYKNEKRSRKRRGAKCPRRDTQSCGKLFFSDLYRLTKKYKVRLAIKTTIPRMKDYRVSPKKKNYDYPKSWE